MIDLIEALSWMLDCFRGGQLADPDGDANPAAEKRMLMATRLPYSISLKLPAGLIFIVLLAVTAQWAIAQGPPPVTAPPVVTGITPSFGSAAQPVDVTLSGRNFIPGQTSINVTGTGLTSSSLTVLSSTTARATFTVAPDAAAGIRRISVTTSLGTSPQRPFTILSLTPALSRVTPASASPGASATLTLNGTNFVNGATSVAISGLAVTPTVQFISSTSIKATFTVPGDAAAGVRNITVTTTVNGTTRTSNARPFVINSIVPTLTRISPISGSPGTQVIMVLTGKNFVSGGTSVTIGDLGVTPTIEFLSPGSVKATFTIPAAAAPGTKSVVLKTTVLGVERTSTARTFVINNIAPTLTAVSPSSGNASAEVVLTLTGKNFVDGNTAVAISGLAVEPAVEFISSSSIKATFEIPEGTAPGPRTVTVTTNPGGVVRSSNTRPFTVTSAVPMLTAAGPAVGNAGQSVHLILTGKNFVEGGTSITISGDPAIEIDAADVTLNPARTVARATVVLDVMEPAGSRLITVTTDHGTSNSRPFRIIAANLVPTLTTVSPAEGIAGDEVTVTFTGTNFVWEQSAINIVGMAATAIVTTVPNPTSLTAVLTIAANATATEDATLSVTTPHGTSETKPFTVKTTPKLTSITPNSGGAGAQVDVTISGKNFTGSVLELEGDGVVLDSYTIVNATTITAVFTVDEDTEAATLVDVTVTKEGQGTSNVLEFTTTVDWSPTDDMAQTRLWGHTATLLNAEVLVAGGTTDLFEPSDESELHVIDDEWELSETMQAARSMHTATWLGGELVLVAGGEGLATAELYTPGAGWAATGSLGGVRFNHAAIARNGLVYVIGGADAPNTALDTVQSWQPANGTWTTVASMNVARVRPTATILPGNQILVTGGYDASGNPIASAEVFDGTSWTLTAETMAFARAGHIAVALSNGKVLVAGGIDADGEPISNVEIYDHAATDKWTTVASMKAARHGHAATLTLDGKVLVTGGFADEDTTRLKSAELYNPSTNKWQFVGSMNIARAYHTITAFDDAFHNTDDDRVLVTGGADDDDGKTAEIYDPVTD